MPGVVTPKQCAVYARVSTDERLDQQFNSIDAQREAGRAFIASQRHEGWLPVADDYEDGGFSGGSMERPALKRLLLDIDDGRIDVVVVYKIDRLTRSLADFAKMVEVFDRHGVSFVSVTQQFNTTTPMGRLTLNILLSFAQFEREVTGERIRDKLAASKAKGMWMGGVPPLGYDVAQRRLVINPAEAKLVRHVFTRFAELGDYSRLTRELQVDGYHTKAWVTQKGRSRVGTKFTKQCLYKMLRNRVYLGDITHKGKAYAGQHEPIISVDLWDKVHAVFATSPFTRAHDTKFDVQGKTPALLRGLLFGEFGERMLPTYTNKKGGRRYTYYYSALAKQHGAGASQTPRLPAADIDRLVMDQVRAALDAPEIVLSVLKEVRKTHPQLDEARVCITLKQLYGIWDQLYPAEQNRLLRLLVERVQLKPGGLEIAWRELGMYEVAAEIADQPLVKETRALEEAAA